MDQFDSLKDFKEAMPRWAVAENFEMQIGKTDKERTTYIKAGRATTNKAEAERDGSWTEVTEEAGSRTGP